MRFKRKVRNVAKGKPITAKEARAMADYQIWQRRFKPDYDQVVLRVSSAATNGLKNGAPPPIVT